MPCSFSLILLFPLIFPFCDFFGKNGILEKVECRPVSKSKLADFRALAIDNLACNITGFIANFSFGKYFATSDKYVLLHEPSRIIAKRLIE